jgi:hypothetical protein
MLETPEARRTARTHGDAMDRKLTVAGEKRWSEILHPHARSAGDEDHIRIGEKAPENRVAFVGHKAGEVDETTIAFNEGGEHRTIRIDDAMTVGLRPGRQQLIAGHDQAHSRPAKHANLVDTNGTEYADVLRPQAASSVKERRTLKDVLAAPADMFAGRNGGEGGDG